MMKRMDTGSDAIEASQAAARQGLDVSQIAQSGLMVALLAVAAQVTIAIGPVPFTLQILVVALIAMLFSPQQAALTIAAYLLLGAAGVPVFSAMRGGIAHLFGPTGGYLYGYIASVALGAFVRRLVVGRTAEPSTLRSCVADAAAAVVALTVCYVTGTVHFMVVGAMAGTTYGLLYVLGVCVVPFVFVDLLKCAAAVLIAQALRRAIPTL